MYYKISDLRNYNHIYYFIKSLSKTHRKCVHLNLFIKLVRKYIFYSNTKDLSNSMKYYLEKTQLNMNIFLQ